jgi:putative peptidoglycan lipid II flippase
MLIAVGISTGAAALVSWLLRVWWAGPAGGFDKLEAVVALLVVGLVDVVCYLALARMLRIAEVTDVLGVLTRRLRR